ncbi:UxaA family hydrolase [Flavobacterium rhizosphaerae]|uniref:Altronate dehydratase family protein n=1 Tax=Flavobacterium rhizosphaerae TaxID=3163298 RepID=A0ABW8YWC2_9FLAO
MNPLVLKINDKDNVLVALQDLASGSQVMYEGISYRILESIPAKHKFFMQDMKTAEAIIMYGVLVGKVQCNVKQGMRMSVENTKHAAEPFAYREVAYRWEAPDVSLYKARTFNGYHRTNGTVGTANYWLFIPTVFCENRNLDIIKESLYAALGYAVDHKYKFFTHELVKAYEEGQDINEISFEPNAYPKEKRLFKNIDGIKFLNHTGGCGGTRQDSRVLSRLLAAYADHPNVAGVTLLSLGCQHIQLPEFKQDILARNPGFDKPLLQFEQQTAVCEEFMIKHAIHETFKCLVEANRQEREPATLDKLTIGVKCGGSDGFSGISANPAVGHCSDLLVGLGAKVLLAEFPELCGVEQDIIDRAVDKPTAEKFIQLMTSYDTQAHSVGSGFFMNPSPGNIKDGLITDAIKSAGAAKKAGSSPVVDVLDYTEPATKPGLSLVCTPGNDVEATTGQAGSGATLILFTTGLGTPTGNPVCPTIKVATNSNLASRMRDIIDIDTGAIIRGEKSITEMGEEILEYCIKVASGEEIPKAVQLNQDDFIPWKRGVSL